MKKVLLLLSFFCSYFFLRAQEIEVGDAEMEVITVSEWNILLTLNTSGCSVGYQYGKTPNYKDKHLWEVEFAYTIHHKAYLGRTFLEGRLFCYGKLYDLFFLRGGYGYQRVITTKPYYGGVQISYFLSAGISICFGLPTYLEIIKRENDVQLFVTERYNPDNPDHQNIDNILGAARFFDRFHKIAVRPGFYSKTGVNFDFSKNPLKMQVLEIGVSVAMVFPFIKQMAFIKANPAFFSAYIAYCFGKKKPRYDL